MWNCIALIIFWVVWTEKNSHYFEEKKQDLSSPWGKIKFLASLMETITKEFKDFPLSLIIISWKNSLF